MNQDELARMRPELERIVASALDQASGLGATQAEVNASFSAGYSATVRMREVETLEHHRDQGVSLTCYFGQKKGSASTSDLGPEAITETVEKACSLASFASEDECVGLAQAELMATQQPDLDLYHPWPASVTDALELALECESAALDVDDRVTNSEGATVSTHEGVQVYANSHGFTGAVTDSQHSMSCAVLAADGTEMQRDFDYTVARSPDELLSPARVGALAGRAAVQRLGSVKPATTTVPVLFPARLARGLFGSLVGAVSGGNLYRRATFLLEALGEQVFSDIVQVSEQPHIHRGLASAAYDHEGVATRERVLIEDGRLRGYVLASYYARKLGLETTGNAGGIHNLIVDSTAGNLDDLLADMGTGVLLTELMGQGVNLVTGDYSRGAAGFWVENGEIQYPIHEFTVAGNLAQMYKGIAAVGSDVDKRGAVQCGSVLIDELTIAGT